MQHRERSNPQQIIPGTDTELSNAIEDLIEARDTYNKKLKDTKMEKEVFEAASTRAAKIMIEAGKDSCRHAGMTFRVKSQKN